MNSKALIVCAPVPISASWRQGSYSLSHSLCGKTIFQLVVGSATTYVQSVKRGAGHQADGLNLEVFHPDFLVLFIIEVEFDNSFYSFTEDVQRYILIR